MDDKVRAIVGIGASAGGLEALEHFFQNIPDGLGISYVVIQHLSPDYKSMMNELLAKKTKLPIHIAQNGLLVKPDCIYLIPPKKNLTIFHGKLIISDQEISRDLIRLPIDIFFESLAADMAERSIGIILSGTGSDGTRGIRSIKEAGGIVLCQTEETAKFDGMPRSAMATGLVDFELAPEDMAEKLVAIIQHPYNKKSSREKNLMTEEDNILKILALLREQQKLDFTHYKPSTIMRRMERRMTINQLTQISEYAKYLEVTPKEVNALFKDMLIGVTNFFRDPEVFEALEKLHLPKMIQNIEGPEIRVWVPGCSTGEEAYSLAICIKQVSEVLGIPINCKIFATDVDKEAILTAGTGEYPKSIELDVPRRFLAKYFIRKESSYQISRNIREMVVFANHNVIKDPPFTNINLLSCRNLLIYLQNQLQTKVMDFFNFSLVENGLLVLGKSETVGDMNNYFDSLNHKLRIYRSRGRYKSRHGANIIERTGNPVAKGRAPYHISTTNLRYFEEERILNSALEMVTANDEIILFIANENNELLYSFGDTGKIISLPRGKMAADLLKMVHKDISIPIATGLQSAFENNKTIRYSNINLKQDSSLESLELNISPFKAVNTRDRFALITLAPLKEPAAASEAVKPLEYHPDKEAEQRIQDLERELQFTRENLQATVEELETSNEELQATNEELLASNEELQSTNEELQSVNEELHTVNSEYQFKIMELTELNNDVDNLLSTTEISSIFLDDDLCLRKYTSKVTDFFKIREEDKGKPVNHLVHDFSDIDFHHISMDVQKSSDSYEGEFQTQKGNWYLIKIIPYQISDTISSGVVITFIEISKHKKLERATSEYKAIFDKAGYGVVFQDSVGKITQYNQAALDILGLTADEILGRSSLDPQWRSVRKDHSPFPGEEHPAMVALKTGKPVSNVIMGVHNPRFNNLHWILISSTPLFLTDKEKPYHVFTTFIDVTENANIQNKIERQKTLYNKLFRNMKSGCAIQKVITNEAGKPVDFEFIDVNEAFEKLTGIKSERFMNNTLLSIFPEIQDSSFDWIGEYGKVALAGKELQIEEYFNGLEKKLQVNAYQPEHGFIITVCHEIDG